MRAKFVISPVPKISLKKLKNCTKLEKELSNGTINNS